VVSPTFYPRQCSPVTDSSLLVAMVMYMVKLLSLRVPSIGSLTCVVSFFPLLPSLLDCLPPLLSSLACYRLRIWGVDGALYSLSLFTPSIVSQFGYTATTSNLLTVPIYVWACILTVGVGYYADKFGKRTSLAPSSGTVLDTTSLPRSHFQLHLPCRRNDGICHPDGISQRWPILFRHLPRCIRHLPSDPQHHRHCKSLPSSDR
jgi:hypothetical protein